MRICACLSFFSEDPAWLTACVASLTKAQVDHLVCCDGPYLLYPNSIKRWRSTQQEYQAIMGAAYGAGISLTLHGQQGPWVNGEVEKRNYLLELGKATGCDWLLIIDADELVTESYGLKAALSDVSEDVAYYLLNEQMGTPNLVRGLYRNVPDLHIRVTHYGYSHGEQLLWDGSGVPAADLTANLVLEHRQRLGQRNMDKWLYYKARDEQGVERIPA